MCHRGGFLLAFAEAIKCWYLSDEGSKIVAVTPPKRPSLARDAVLDGLQNLHRVATDEALFRT
jgi:hypothetical protein